MILWAVTVGALALALVAAVLLALRLRPHLPVALALGAGLVIDLVVGAHDKATGWGLAQLLAHRPWGTTDLVLYHFSNALETAWPATVAALAWSVFAPSARRRALALVLAAWALANVVLVAGYPLGSATTQRVLLAAELAALVAGAAAAWRGWGGPRWGITQASALGLLAAELVVVTLGPYRYSVYSRWDLAQVCYSLAFAALAIVQGIARSRLRPPQAGPPS